jgi:hypothetical protein
MNKITFSVTIKTLVLILVLPLLSTCSSYKIAYDFTPPKTKQGLVCIQQSQSQLNQCNNSCYYQYQRCLKTSQNQAQKDLPNLLKEYPLQLESWLNQREQYRRDLDFYELRMDLAEARRETYLGHCMKQGTKKSKCTSRHGYTSLMPSISRPYFNKSRPVKPTLSSVTTHTRAQNCSQNCGCQTNFRQSYAGCGGAVRSKKVCVKNCN